MQKDERKFCMEMHCRQKLAGRWYWMEGAIFECPEDWAKWLPSGIHRAERPEELAGREWSILALMGKEACSLNSELLRCRILLVPGNVSPSYLARIQAEYVITYGLSPRDSLTLSSLTDPVLCVQRILPRPDGALIEPREFPLPELPASAAELLPLLGLRLLQMPLTENIFLSYDKLSK